MSIQIVGDYPGPVCLYDTVDGMAFGPTFEDRAEAEAFMRWFDKPIAGTGASDYHPIRFLKLWTYAEQKADADRWREFWADHGKNATERSGA